MSLIDHEFGGISTELKLSMLNAYLKAFTTALSRKNYELWYIDAFAGTGERTVKFESSTATLFEEETDERIERFRGSAKLAIDVEPKFDRLFFIEKKQKFVLALNQLARDNSERKIEILHGDSNSEIRKLVSENDWRKKRAVLFLDPYGMNVEWSTLEAIRATEAIDVWYLVSLAGLYRQATRAEEALTTDKQSALTRMLGTDTWRVEWYKETQRDLFDDIKKQRVANVDEIRQYVKIRLDTLFPKVLEPATLKHDTKNFPNFALFFAISNPNSNAINLATRIADHILSSGKASQVRPR